MGDTPVQPVLDQSGQPVRAPQPHGGGQRRRAPASPATAPRSRSAASRSRRRSTSSRRRPCVDCLAELPSESDRLPVRHFLASTRQRPCLDLVLFRLEDRLRGRQRPRGGVPAWTGTRVSSFSTSARRSASPSWAYSLDAAALTPCTDGMRSATSRRSTGDPRRRQSQRRARRRRDPVRLLRRHAGEHEEHGQLRRQPGAQGSRHLPLPAAAGESGRRGTRPGRLHHRPGVRLPRRRTTRTASTSPSSSAAATPTTCSARSRCTPPTRPIWRACSGRDGPTPTPGTKGSDQMVGGFRCNNPSGTAVHDYAPEGIELDLISLAERQLDQRRARGRHLDHQHREAPQHRTFLRRWPGPTAPRPGGTWRCGWLALTDPEVAAAMASSGTYWDLEDNSPPGGGDERPTDGDWKSPFVDPFEPLRPARLGQHVVLGPVPVGMAARLRGDQLRVRRLLRHPRRLVRGR